MVCARTLRQSLSIRRAAARRTQQAGAAPYGLVAALLIIVQYTVDGSRNKLAGSFGTAVEAAVAYARAIDKTVMENGMRWTHSLADVCGAGAWSTHLLIRLPHMHSRCALLSPILVPHIARR